MKTVQSLLPVFGLVAAAKAWGAGWNDTIVWTTVTTDVYTTFCPDSTTFTQGTKTYTATASETLTITDCPCTISHTVKPNYTPTTSSIDVLPPAPASNGTWVPPVWITVTETVNEYTTYCPAPTTVVQGNQTYTVTDATTLTVTNCPCTQTTTKPATTVVVTVGTTTTYCPVPTTITTGGNTITVSTTGYVTLPVCDTTTVPVKTSTIVVGSISTYCPVPTTITTGGTTYPVSTPGTVTLPVVATTVVPDMTTPAPIYTSSVTKSFGTVISVKPSASATTTGPLQATNAAVANNAGFGAFAAVGLVALFL